MMQIYTVRALMDEANLTYNNTYRLIRRMEKCGLIQEIKPHPRNKDANHRVEHVPGIGIIQAKKYGFLMNPNRFLREELEQLSRLPAPGFFNNPFNLKNAKDLRIQKWREV